MTMAAGALEQVLRELVHTRHGKAGASSGSGSPRFPGSSAAWAKEKENDLDGKKKTGRVTLVLAQRLLPFSRLG